MNAKGLVPSGIGGMIFTLIYTDNKIVHLGATFFLIFF